MNVNTLQKRPGQAKLIIVPVLKDEKLNRSLTTFSRRYGIGELLAQDFKAETNELVETYARKKGETSKIHFLGLGERADYVSFRKVFQSFFAKKSKKIEDLLTIDLSHLTKINQRSMAEAAVNAAVTGIYKLGMYKTSGEEPKPFDLQIVINDEEGETIIKRAQDIANTQVKVMDLVNAPANKLTPQQLGDWAIASGREHGFKVEVFNKQKIAEEGLNAVLAVNQGSEVLPAFIVAQYHHADAKKHIGIVGKGVTFDTGGISIKPSAGMHYMKSDMGGAAAALGTIEAVAKLKLPVNLTVIVPAVENAVDAKSMKPGDIIHSYSGKSIEVIDTDAEGRLILSDALAYMTKNYQTDLLIDFATLTGSVIATLGYHAAGIFTNSEFLKSQLTRAGDASGEKLWPLPIWKEYEEDLESDVADVKNYSGKPLAGAITAAKFLEVFINDHPNWCHIDIAGTAFGDSPLGKQKHSTAFGVSLMVDFLENLE